MRTRHRFTRCRAAYTQLRLARSAVEDLRLPWQRPRVPSPRTPARVRRGFRPPQAGPHLLEGQPAEGRLVAALASDAELLVLDEPTSGLDPLMNSVFQDCIREVKAEGRTVLLSSRILAEVEALCDRVSIVRAGRTLQAGTLAELRKLTRTAVAAETAASQSGLERLPGVHGLDVDDHHVRFDVDTAQLDAAMRRLAKLGIRSLVSQPPTLGELFLRHYGDELAGEAAAAAAAGR